MRFGRDEAGRNVMIHPAARMEAGGNARRGGNMGECTPNTRWRKKLKGRRRERRGGEDSEGDDHDMLNKWKFIYTAQRNSAGTERRSVLTEKTVA